MKRIALLILLLVGTTGLSFADEHDDVGPCSHPEFVTHDCLDSLGVTGQGGTDGVDGLDGVVGPMGPVGPVGPSGSHGKDFTRYLNQLRSFNQSYGEYLAATQAAQVYLPQDKQSRLTFGMSRVKGNTGLGVGYALKLDDEDKIAFTLSLGVSGGETAASASVGFEF